MSRHYETSMTQLVDELAARIEDDARVFRNFAALAPYANPEHLPPFHRFLPRGSVAWRASLARQAARELASRVTALRPASTRRPAPPGVQATHSPVERFRRPCDTA